MSTQSLNFGEHITVRDSRNDSFGDNGTTISWYSLGSVSISEAEDFYLQLGKAINAAKQI